MINRKLEKMEQERATFEQSIVAHFTTLQSAIARLADTSATNTELSFTSTAEVFMTKSDTLIQHAETNAKMAALQNSNDATNAKMTAIQRTLDILLHRFTQEDPNAPKPAPDENSSPPRKMLKFDSIRPADSSMEAHEAGVGEG